MTVLRMPDVVCRHCRSKSYARSWNRISRSQNGRLYRRRDCKRTFLGLVEFRGRHRALNVITWALWEVAHNLLPKGVQSIIVEDRITMCVDIMREYVKSIHLWIGYAAPTRSV